MTSSEDPLAGLESEPANDRASAKKQAGYQLPPEVIRAVKEVTILMDEREVKVTNNGVVAHAIRYTYGDLAPALLKHVRENK